MRRLPGLICALSLIFSAQVHAESWHVEHSRAQAYLERGEYALAQASLLKALSTCPDSGRLGILMNLASVQEAAGNRDGALKTLYTALSYADQPSNQSYRQMIEQAIAKLSGGAGVRDGQPKPAQSGAVLSGGVSFQDHLKPIDQTLGSGNLFDQKAAQALLQSPQSSAVWYRLPKGMAGTWLSQQATMVYYKDFSTGFVERPNRTYDAKSSATLGLCKDRTGAVWDRVNVNYWSVPTEYEQAIGKSFVRKSDVVVVNDREIQTYTEGVTFEIDKRNGKIITSFQYAGFNVYRLLSDGVMRWEQHRQVYDHSGRVKIASSNIANDTLVKPFDPSVADQERRLSFESYLNSKGLQHLLPR